MEVRARLELNNAREALAVENIKDAVTHYSRALHWYLPGGASETAAEELLELGLRLLDDDREEIAMRALLRVRSGLYGARWLAIPRMDLIRRTEPVLADMLTKQKIRSDASPTLYEKQKQAYLTEMREPSRPAVLPGLSAFFGFLLWVTAAFFFIFKFFQGRRAGWSRAWIWATIWGLGFSIWLWGLKWA